MKYTEKELFAFMDARRIVRVTSTSGNVYTGPCWAYGEVVSREDFELPEACLDIESTTLLLSEIEKIEFAD